jgi:hypothetical protein
MFFFVFVFVFFISPECCELREKQQNVWPFCLFVTNCCKWPVDKKTALSSSFVNRSLLPVSPSLYLHWNLLRFKVDLYKVSLDCDDEFPFFPLAESSCWDARKRNGGDLRPVWEMMSSASSWEIGRLATISATGLLARPGLWLLDRVIMIGGIVKSANELLVQSGESGDCVCNFREGLLLSRR